ncbi:Gfo/Idh/MocA family protein [Pararhizobium haloflavum]|uniref:Gfo/Idh/MocA family protein n=1 Tax=Pararhizobium haloflavum TaxID=2037914 RepID=UPI0018E45AA8|nr:Gfo/Idh/MocA family oxidoreductase [Pararhizobium haloflavum]
MTATETEIPVAIVGVGKIARDQHMPSIERSPTFRLAAVVSRNAHVDGVENFSTVGALLEARPDIPALALCMPPQVRFEAAHAALLAGRHVMLEKPPGATIAEVRALQWLATDKGCTLFASWHSRYAHAVDDARQWLKERAVRHVSIVWKEDVRRWHPGQDWVWQAGGLGVFDPGINALSILTAILPHPVHVTTSELSFPQGRDAPIAARVDFANGRGAVVEAVFDWRQEGPQTWDIDVVTDDGTLKLSDGGARLAIDGAKRHAGDDREYDGLYARFANLIATGTSDVDLSPLVHVADAFMLARRVNVAPFDDDSVSSA